MIARAIAPRRANTLLITVSGLVAVALAATVLPARQALRVDPAATMRAE